MTDSELSRSVFLITNKIKFTHEALIPFEIWLKCAELVRDVDMNDIAFLSLSELIGTKLWTGDKTLMKGLLKEGFSNFTTTEELFQLRQIME